MDSLLVFLSVLSLGAGVVLAFVVYQLMRMLIQFFREFFSPEDQKRYRLLRLSDRAVSVICAICFLALVL